MQGAYLCAVCGTVEPAGTDVPAEPWMLEWQAREYRAAIDEPLIPRWTFLVRGFGVVAVAVTIVLCGVSAAFLAFGRINFRYVGTFGVLLATVGVASVIALLWGLSDPNTPLKDRYRRRLAETERTLDAIERDGEEPDQL